MRSVICLLFLLPYCITVRGQSYADSIARFRSRYTAELLADSRAPIKPSQAKYLAFYKPDASYRIGADFAETRGSKPFLIPTHSGKQKPYKEYGTLTFMLKGQRLVLHVYQGMNLVKEDAHRDDLFVPFNDETNYETTYAGGRYIDLTVRDITGNKVELDFNKCYNPYCAYADGYSCPIPPAENHLSIRIEAGERTFQQ